MKKYLFIVVVLLIFFGCGQKILNTKKSKAPKGFATTSDGKNLFFTKIPEKPWEKINFPFSRNHLVYCTQGNMSPYPKSHFYCNTMYALDLATPKENAAGKIYSIFKGKAFVLNDCECSRENKGDSYNNCSCNGGYGNLVRIIREDGTYALYAHLSKIFIRDGQEVGIGACIGLEGVSGAAGNRHLHFSIHKTNFSDDLKIYLNPGIAIPFEICIKYHDCDTFEWVCSSDVRWHENIKKAVLMEGVLDYSNYSSRLK